MDVGTEAVKALAIGGAASLNYFDAFGVFNNHDFGQSVLKKAMRNTLLEVQREAGQNFKKIIISLPPDIFKARVASHSLERNNPKKPIGRKEEKEIHAAVFGAVREKVALAHAKESGISPNHFDFLRSTILQIKIDGYEVENIIGYGGKNLEFRVLSVFMPENYYRDFEAVAKELNLRIIKLAHPFENLSRVFGKESGVFVDVGGDITQFCLMDRGIPAMIGEFEFGGKNFSEILSHSLGLSEENGRNLKERYSSRDLTEDARKRVEDICAPAVAEWTSLLREQLAKSGNIMRLKLYLWGGASQFFGLTEYFDREQWEIEYVSSPQFFNSMLISHASK